MAGLSLKNIEKIYPNGLMAVDNLNLEIKDGEFMVLVGPSGCAKSTTLRMIAGLEELNGGEIYIGNKLVNDLEPMEREIAMVFQNYSLYPHMTVYENIAFGLKLSKVPKEKMDKRIKETAEFLQITELLERLPKELSGGQKQRVAIGRAIVRKPEVFLFDEPLSNLDAKLRVEMRVGITKLHKDLKKQGKTATMIYVTHDQVEAMTMGDRICVMNYGKIMQVDTPINLYNKPKNKFTAGFIGSPSMNLQKAELLVKNDRLYVKLGNYELELPKEKYKKLMLDNGRKIWFGIRPEDLVVFDREKSNNKLIGKASLVEQMGSELLVYFELEQMRFVSRISSEYTEELKKGFNHEFSFDMNNCHIFDFFTEENLII